MTRKVGLKLTALAVALTLATPAFGFHGSPGKEGNGIDAARERKIENDLKQGKDPVETGSEGDWAAALDDGTQFGDFNTPGDWGIKGLENSKRENPGRSTLGHNNNIRDGRNGTGD
jgi:hypothetical protein